MDAIKVLYKNLMTNDLSKKRMFDSSCCQLLWLAASSIIELSTQPIGGGSKSRFSSTRRARNSQDINPANMEIDLRTNCRLVKAGMSSG